MAASSAFVSILRDGRAQASNNHGPAIVKLEPLD
jgi:hypothetical protein